MNTLEESFQDGLINLCGVDQEEFDVAQCDISRCDPIGINFVCDFEILLCGVDDFEICLEQRGLCGELCEAYCAQIISWWGQGDL